MFICAGESEQFDFAIPIGIGMTDVAINLTKLCLSQKPEFLFFVGTAGSYGEKNIFDIVESKTAANIENSFFNAKAYTPIDNVISAYGTIDVSRETREADDNSLSSVGLKPKWSERSGATQAGETREADDNSLSSVGLKPKWSERSGATQAGETIVNSSNYITTDKSLGNAYVAKNIHIENMEYYAVLKVAKHFGIPAAGVFIVTNYCDENAHRDFLQNHKVAMEKLTHYIKEK